MKNKCHRLALIPARGGSKGIPRKNIRQLGDKPLIAYAIEVARASEWIDRVVVSTEDAEIARIARNYGAEVPFMRPIELALDDSPEWSVWRHAIQTLGAGAGDVFVCIPPTAPLRSVEDVDGCIKTLLESDADLVITVKPAERNPYFNMVVLDEAGYARLVVQPEKTIHRRQAAPPIFDVTTVAYAARPEFVLRAESMFDGKVKTVVVPPERALDIDTELDFRFAEFLMGLNPVARAPRVEPGG